MKYPLFFLGLLFFMAQFASTANAQRHIFNRNNKAWLVRYDDDTVDSSHGDKALRLKIADVPKPASGNTIITARLQRYTVDVSGGTNAYKLRDGNAGDIVLNGVIYSEDPAATNRERKRVKFVLTGTYPKTVLPGGVVTVSVHVWGIFDHGKTRPPMGGGGGAHKDDDALAIRLVIDDPTAGDPAPAAPQTNPQTRMSGAFAPCPEEPDVDVLEEEDASNLETPPDYDSTN